MKTTEHANEAQIVKANEDLVQMIRKQVRNDASLKDDLLQEGRIALVKAARLWSAERNTSFRTYAGFWVRHAMVDFLRKQHPACISMDESDGCGETLHDTVGTAPTQEGELLAKERAAATHHATNGLTSPSRRDVSSRVARGMSIADIAKARGTSSKRVSETLNRAIPDLREALTRVLGDE